MVSGTSERLQRCRVHMEDRLLDGMHALESGAAGIALIVDSRDRLVGTLTDGDVRRALLSGASLESPVNSYMQRAFSAVSLSTGRAEVLELMNARGIGQVPIVEPDGRLLGLHLLRELVGGIERPNWA